MWGNITSSFLTIGAFMLQISLDSILVCSVSFPSPCDSSLELHFSSGGECEQLAAFTAVDGGLRVRKDGGDVSARRLDVHKVGFGGLHQSLQFMLGFSFVGIHVQKVHFHCDGQRIYIQ